MSGSGDLILPFAVDLILPCVIKTARIDMPAVKPEGDIDSLDLLKMVGIAEGARQKHFALIIVFQGIHRLLLFLPERNDVVRFQGSRELTGNDRIVPAIGTLCGCCGLITDEFGSTGGTVIGPHFSGIFSPSLPGILSAAGIFLCRCRPGCGLRGFLFSLFLSLFLSFFIGFFLRLFRRGIFVCVKLLDLLHSKGASAVIALQFSGPGVKTQRAGTCRTLIIGDLLRHISSNKAGTVSRSTLKWNEEPSPASLRFTRVFAQKALETSHVRSMNGPGSGSGLSAS